MSKPNQPNNFPTFYPAIFDATTGTSLAGNITSEPIPVHFAHGYSIQAEWTGTPNGQFYIEASNDGVIWSEVIGSAIVVAGTAGSNIWNMPAEEYMFAHLVWLNTSSTGTVSANCFVKVSGGLR